MPKKAETGLTGDHGVNLETLDNTQGPRGPRRTKEVPPVPAHRSQRIIVLPTRARVGGDKGENL